MKTKKTKTNTDNGSVEKKPVIKSYPLEKSRGGQGVVIFEGKVPETAQKITVYIPRFMLMQAGFKEEADQNHTQCTVVIKEGEVTLKIR